MRQWRILHTESSRGWGGQEVRVFVELEWMRARGHWVALAAHPKSAIAQYAQKAGIAFYPLHTHKALLPVAVARMTAWLIRNRIDVVNTHSSNDGWLAGLAARWAGRVLIRSRHIEVDYPNRFWSGLAYRHLPHHVLTTSQRIADRLVEELEVPRPRVSCISTGVDLVKFNPQMPGTLRRELGLAPDVELVGMISVLRSWKGHATFLDAAAKLLRESKRPLHFVIAGDGPGREELTGKIVQEPWKDRVTLLGHRHDVPNILASLDVLVLPSFAHEGIPQIILQAQAMARAVVATTIGGIPEVVEDGVTGLLVSPRDPDALAGKIRLVLDDAALRTRLGQAARQSIEKNHSLDAMGERLLELYEKLAHK
ncbi:MAG TPA: glycosyltransferase family 4 protein [Candidatus Methylacidiphilales bacterium]